MWSSICTYLPKCPWTLYHSARWTQVEHPFIIQDVLLSFCFIRKKHVIVCKQKHFAVRTFAYKGIKHRDLEFIIIYRKIQRCVICITMVTNAVLSYKVSKQQHKKKCKGSRRLPCGTPQKPHWSPQMINNPLFLLVNVDFMMCRIEGLIQSLKCSITRL